VTHQYIHFALQAFHLFRIEQEGIDQVIGLALFVIGLAATGLIVGNKDRIDVIITTAG